ncbi:RHS repeat domain-containing protein, partial [Stenotrophomonas maltophilia group sp. RNC7]|uniref:RHS repeat domain-containing protein n=1 Tax=Stenotrophomonas maltophilia group sp. RNC7 TaxID=3071467 RepID=UPI0027DF4A24
RLLQTLRPNGTLETRQYDAAGQLIQLRDVTAQGELIQEYHYTYDAAGNVIEESDGPGSEASWSAGTVTMTYTADNRLDTYNGEKVQYDADGNMIFGPLNGT